MYKNVLKNSPGLVETFECSWCGLLDVSTLDSQVNWYYIYTIILLKSACRRSQTADRNSCSIVSGDVSNCSYRLKVHPVTSSHLSSASNFFIREKHPKSQGNRWPARMFIWMTLLPAMNASGAGRHGWAPTNSTNLYGSDCSVCVCSHMHVRACVMCLQYMITIFYPGW